MKRKQYKHGKKHWNQHYDSLEPFENVNQNNHVAMVSGAL